MRARAALTVAAPRRVERMDSVAPVCWRPTPEGIYLIGTSASPVGDDDVTVQVTVRAGATATVRSNAASVAWSGSGTRAAVEAAVGPGAALDWRLEPLITTAGCRHHQRAHVRLAPDARLRWSETLLLGRHGEPTGSLVSELVVDVAGEPLLCHSLGVGPDHPGWAGPAVLGPARAVGLELRAGRGATATAPAAGPGWSLSPLDGPGSLALAVGRDALEVEEALAAAAALLPPW